MAKETKIASLKDKKLPIIDKLVWLYNEIAILEADCNPVTDTVRQTAIDSKAEKDKADSTTYTSVELFGETISDIPVQVVFSDNKRPSTCEQTDYDELVKALGEDTVKKFLVEKKVFTFDKKVADDLAKNDPKVKEALGKNKTLTGSAVKPSVKPPIIPMQMVELLRKKFKPTTKGKK